MNWSESGNVSRDQESVFITVLGHGCHRAMCTLGSKLHCEIALVCQTLRQLATSERKCQSACSFSYRQDTTIPFLYFFYMWLQGPAGSGARANAVCTFAGPVAAQSCPPSTCSQVESWSVPSTVFDSPFVCCVVPRTDSSSTSRKRMTRYHMTPSCTNCTVKGYKATVYA
jgi:hypothetical protein